MSNKAEKINVYSEGLKQVEEIQKEIQAKDDEKFKKDIKAQLEGVSKDRLWPIGSLIRSSLIDLIFDGNISEFWHNDEQPYTEDRQARGSLATVQFGDGTELIQNKIKDYHYLLLVKSQAESNIQEILSKEIEARTLSTNIANKVKEAQEFEALVNSQIRSHRIKIAQLLISTVSIEEIELTNKRIFFITA